MTATPTANEQRPRDDDTNLDGRAATGTGAKAGRLIAGEKAVDAQGRLRGTSVRGGLPIPATSAVAAAANLLRDPARQLDALVLDAFKERFFVVAVKRDRVGQHLIEDHTLRSPASATGLQPPGPP